MSSPSSPQEQDRFDIFNRDKTIGVSARVGGAVVGIYLSEKVRTLSERALTQQILAVAGVAAMRGRLGVRERMEAEAAETGTPVAPTTFEVLTDVPTAAEYAQFRLATLKY